MAQGQQLARAMPGPDRGCRFDWPAFGGHRLDSVKSVKLSIPDVQHCEVLDDAGPALVKPAPSSIFTAAQ